MGLTERPEDEHRADASIHKQVQTSRVGSADKERSHRNPVELKKLS